jgi:DNA-binding protein WhiA
MAGSFSAGAKAEMCRNIPSKNCCVLAECFGVLLFCNSFTAESVRIITECHEFAQILPKLFHKAFDLDFDVLPESGNSGKQVFAITDIAKIDRIMNIYGFDRNVTFSLRVNLPIVEEDCCKAAFLRGAFLAGGSVTDPEKGYHMEIATTHKSVAMETHLLIHEIAGFLPKSAERSGGQVLYLKQSEQISDLLTYLGAPIAAMGIMEARLEKELNNKVNRRCNCDDANTSKVVEAAQEQLTAIRTLRERGMFDKLPVKLQQAVVARGNNPESSLAELAAMMEPPISKPAMNHRLQKLVQMAQEGTR